MGVAWPAALLGLIALALPLLIHLLARGEFQRIAVATTQFVRERPRLRWRRLQISHPLLLALRMALLALCVLLIAQPFRTLPAGDDDTGERTFVSTRLSATQVQTLLDQQAATSHWLAPGFPSLDQPRPVWQPGRLWSLLDAADQWAPGGVAFNVIAPMPITSPGSLRPTLARNLRWIDGGTAATAGDLAETLNVDIVYDPPLKPTADAVANAIAAWQDAGLAATARVVPATAAVRAPYAVWLSASPLPINDQAPRVVVAQRPLLEGATVTTGFSNDGTSAQRAQHADGVEVRLLDNMLAVDGTPNPNLARDLLSAFVGARMSVPAQDYPVSIDQLTPSTSTIARASLRQRQPLASQIIWLIALLALLERLVSALIMRSRRDA